LTRNQQKEKEEEDRMSLSYSVVIPGGCDSLLSIKIQEKNRFKKKRKKNPDSSPICRKANYFKCIESQRRARENSFCNKM